MPIDTCSSKNFGSCEVCGNDRPEDQLKFLRWRWICLSCLKKEEGKKVIKHANK